MLTDSYPANQDQNKFKAHSSPSLVTQVTYSKDLEFINASPPIDEALSKYLADQLAEHERQQREKARDEARYQQKYGTKKQQTKAENRHRLTYTVNLFNIAYIKVNPSRETVASIAGCHRNTFDNHKRELQHMGFLEWKSGKPTYETNTYFVPDHVANQHIPRPKDFTIPWWLWKAIETVLSKLNWSDKQKFYLQIIKDVVHHINEVYGKERAFEEKNGEKCATGPPKTRAGPKKTIYWQLLAQFSFTFKEKAILSSYGEAPLRTAINDLESYSGKISNPIAFLISRCKAIKSKLEDLAKEVFATPEENLDWLKGYLSKASTMKKCKFVSNAGEINRATKTKKPYLRLMIHTKEAKQSKLIIEQKVNGHWIDKVLDLSREKFRTAVMATLEMAFKYAAS